MDEIIDYVVETPQNTNPNILRGMLQNLGGGGSNDFVLTVIRDNEQEQYRFDKTPEETYAVYETGKNMTIKLVVDSQISCHPIIGYMEMGSGTAAVGYFLFEQFNYNESTSLIVREIWGIRYFLNGTTQFLGVERFFE